VEPCRLFFRRSSLAGTERSGVEDNVLRPGAVAGGPPGAGWVGCGAILHNTSYGRAAIGFARPEDHNLYYVNIAWDGFQRGCGAG